MLDETSVRQLKLSLKTVNYICSSRDVQIVRLIIGLVAEMAFYYESYQ